MGLKGCVVVGIVVVADIIVPPAPAVLLFEEDEGACCERGILGGRGGRYSGRSIGARAVAERVVRGVKPLVVLKRVGLERGTNNSPAEECDRNIRCFVVSVVCDMKGRESIGWSLVRGRLRR